MNCFPVFGTLSRHFRSLFRKVNQFTENPRHFPPISLRLPLSICIHSPFLVCFSRESEPVCREFEALSPTVYALCLFFLRFHRESAPICRESVALSPRKFDSGTEWSDNETCLETCHCTSANKFALLLASVYICTVFLQNHKLFFAESAKSALSARSQTEKNKKEQKRNITGIMKKWWIIILSLSLSVLLSYAAGGAGSMHETDDAQETDNVPQISTDTRCEGILYDAFAGRHVGAREFLNDAMQNGGNVLCTARQNNVQSAKQNTFKTQDFLSRPSFHSRTEVNRYRIAMNIGSGIVSGHLSDYVTATLMRINI